jgi:predicted TIM-barrel fold metal-dependent hydrolase
MIVDVHTHTPRHRAPPAGGAAANTAWRPDQTRPTSLTWDEQMAELEAVDRAIVFNIAADPRQPDPGWDLMYEARRVNDDTAAFVRAYPEKLIGFLSVHPHDPGALDEIDRAVQELGLRGIKLGPNYQNFDPLGEEAFRVFRRAEELGLPILLHQGTSPNRFADLDYAHPRHIDRVAMAFPNLRLILAHMAHPWQADCIAVIRKHPHVYADISAQFYRPWSYYSAFRLAAEWGALGKLLFGSDLPVATPRETMDALWRVNDVTVGTHLPRVPEGELEGILHRDSLALLGLAT